MDFVRENLLYRKGAVGVVLDSCDNVLIVQMIDYANDQWRFAGGGVEEGEKAEAALLRELKEELGSDEFEVLGKSSLVNEYDWPDEVVAHQKYGVLFRGQRQEQFLVRFWGDKSSLKVDENELKAIKWVTLDELKNYFIFPGQWEMAEKLFEELLEISV